MHHIHIRKNMVSFKQFIIRTFLATILWCSFCSHLSAQQEDLLQLAYNDTENELLLFYEVEDLVEIATGTLQPLTRAPAIASVITAEDIKTIGATNITQALESVPGLHVASTYQGGTANFTFRGMHTVFNPQVLIMINGIPINTLFIGSPDSVWRGMPVESISRIEVIRGPGSAIYGADAFAGVINVITKTVNEIEKTEIGARTGSFNTKDTWLSTGGNLWGLDIAFFLEYHKSDGHKEKIDADAQTFFDNLYNTNASNAPGAVSLSEENIDIHLDISKQRWRLRWGYLDHRDLGSYAGVARALDPESRGRQKRTTADVTWHNPNFTDHWDLKAQLSYLNNHADLDGDSVFRVYPRGATPFGDVTGDMVPDAFVDGMIGTPEHAEKHYRVSISSQYKGFEKHLLMFGAGWHKGDMHKISQSRNFGLNPHTGQVSFPLTSNTPLFSVSDTSLVFMDEGKRFNRHVYAQDLWQFAEFWELTAGIRYDHFSDFGESYNPRLALVWLARDDLTTKLLYGEAFRSPSFAETRSKNNPAAWGDPNIKPETIKTTEFALSYHPTKKFQLDLNLFHYDWEDKIEFLPDPNVNAQLIAQNAGRQTGHGLEVATNWQAHNNLNVYANYAWQQSTDETSGEAPGNAPNWQAFLSTDWRFITKWNISGQLNWIGTRQRAPGDNRDALDGYKTVDITLRRSELAQRWEFAVSVRNLFDEEVKEPSQNVSFPTGAKVPLIPNDLPQAGRSAFGEVRYAF